MECMYRVSMIQNLCYQGMHYFGMLIGYDAKYKNSYFSYIYIHSKLHKVMLVLQTNYK